MSAASAAGSGLEWTSYVPFFILPSYLATKTYRVMQQHITASPCNACRQSACVEDPSGLPSWSSTRCTSPCCSGSCTASSNARTPRSIMPANCVNMTALLSDETFPCTQPTFGYTASGWHRSQELVIKGHVLFANQHSFPYAIQCETVVMTSVSR